METAVAWKEMAKNIWSPAFQCYRSAAEVESLHSRILMYAGNCFGSSAPVYGAQALPAAPDYNHHL